MLPGVEVHPIDPAAGELGRLVAHRREVQRDEHAVELAPEEAAVVGHVAGAVRSDRRPVRSATEVGDDLDGAIGADATQRAASDLDNEHGSVGHDDGPFGELKTGGDLADLGRCAHACPPGCVCGERCGNPF
jgi:hypothetical protein